MPEVIARHRIILGGGKDGKERRTIMPGQRVDLDRAIIEEIRSHQPDALQDPRARQQPADPRDVERAQEAVRIVAGDEGGTDGAGAVGQAENQPVTEGRTVGGDGDGNITREQPQGDHESDEL